MKIYIAGPMTGYEKFNRPAFNAASEKLTSQGHVVLNPATLPAGLSEAQYMDICLAMLRCAEGIYMLNEWEYSAGARAENAIAEKLELEIMYERYSA